MDDITAYRLAKAAYNDDRIEFDYLGGVDWDDPFYETMRQMGKRDRGE